MKEKKIKQEITIILPCAGEGSRLGLTTPKELYMIRPGVRLMDFSLAHIDAFPFKERLRVAVVIRPGKREVAEYAAARLPGVQVDTVLFDDRYSEWPGSVYSANELFSGNNLVLLPDSFLSLSGSADMGAAYTRDAAGRTLVEMVTDALSRVRVVFGAIPCSDPRVLATLGAMRVEDGVVTAFQDKPLLDKRGTGLEGFNSFWGCYGFQQSSGEALYRYLVPSVRHRPLRLEEQPFFPPGAIPVKTYYDLGTWESIEAFLNLPKNKMGPRV